MNRVLIAVLLIAIGSAAQAQELDARAYSPAPVGTVVLLAGIGGSDGAVLFDPSTGIADVEADLGVVTTGFGYTFGLAGRQARVLAVFPSAWGRFDGVVRAYLNRCAHVPVELDWSEGEFFDLSALYLVCATHGATYLPESGRCIAGPCTGRSLTPLRVAEAEGKVFLID